MPFVDHSPNDVLRRILSLLTTSAVRNHQEFVDTNMKPKPTIHQAFLTFLLDKYKKLNGNFSTNDVTPFMKKFNLISLDGKYKNPWMPKSYKNETSCKTLLSILDNVENLDAGKD